MTTRAFLPVLLLALAAGASAQRHAGQDLEILERRHAVYEAARARHPEHWSGATRSWSRVETVRLNPADRASGTEAP